jgi:hypothetical protein
MNRIILALSILPLLPCTAQNAAKSEKSSIQIRVLAETVPPDLGQVYLAAGETRTAPFDLPAKNDSEPMALMQRSLTLKTLGRDLTLCTFKLPDAGMSFVIVFSPAKPAGYQAQAIRTDDPSFKRGDVFFLNRTQKTILCKLGTKALKVDAGGTAITRPEGAAAGNFYDVAFASRDAAGDKLLSTTRWPVDERGRSYLFFLEDATGRITYRAVDEFVPLMSARASQLNDAL